MTNMRLRFVVVVVCMLFASSVRADSVLTFEGLQNFESIGSYFDGGAGSLGSGPGPNYGITFSQYALAYIHGQQSGKVTPYPGDPSPPTVLLVFNSANPFGAGYPTSITMDVSHGFSQALSFYYIGIGRDVSVTIYSGLDGTGTTLANQTLSITPEAFSNPTIVDFSGVANSVVFTGGNDQLALDNISFVSPIPEPSGWISLTVGLGGVYLVFSRLRKKVDARDGSFSRVA
jgi:hypothetical protein